jgi:hypothetical protein
MYLRDHFQNAYVTRDINKAIALFEKHYKVHGFVPVELELDVTTPTGSDKLHMWLAYAWVGRTQVELIQPLSGCVQHYVDSLPDEKGDFRPAFNHIAMRRDDQDAMLAEIESLNLPVLLDGTLEGLRFIYVDARAELGHILEYVWTIPQMWEILGWPS